MQNKNVLIVALLITILFFIPSLALSAEVGNIDGLWWSPAPGAEPYFFMVHESEGVALVTALDGTEMAWEAYYGTISGNCANLSVLLSLGITAFNANITFNSTTSAVAVITVCQPIEECVFPLNMEIPLIKLF
jgi:hypothetical protein